MSIQWYLQFAASQPEETYLAWLAKQPAMVGEVDYPRHRHFRIAGFHLLFEPAGDDPIGDDDFAERYGFRFTHRFYCDRATHETASPSFDVLTLAMTFLRDFPDDTVLRANETPWLVRKQGVLAADETLFATSPKWAAYLQPPHWNGPHRPLVPVMSEAGAVRHWTAGPPA